MRVVRISNIVILKVSPDLFELLRYKNGEMFTIIEDGLTPDSCERWVKLIFAYESFEDVRKNIPGYGSAAGVIEPISLRISVIDFAQQISKFYESGRLLS